MISFQYLFWSSLYSLLTLVFSRYSPFYFTLFLFSIVFLSLCVLPILRPIKPHFAFYSTRSTPFKFFHSLVSLCLSVCLSVCPSVSLYVLLSVSLSLSVCLSVCLSVSLSLWSLSLVSLSGLSLWSLSLWSLSLWSLSLWSLYLWSLSFWSLSLVSLPGLSPWSLSLVSLSGLSLWSLSLVSLSGLSLWSLSLVSLSGLSLSLSLVSLSLSLPLFLPFGKGKSFSSEYRCFASLLEIAKYQESLFNNNLTSMISRSKHGLQILSLRCFTSSNQHETFLGFYKHLWSRILSLFSLSSLRWDIVVLACLRLNQTLAAQETETRQIPYFSG